MTPIPRYYFSYYFLYSTVLQCYILNSTATVTDPSTFLQILLCQYLSIITLSTSLRQPLFLCYNGFRNFYTIVSRKGGLMNKNNQLTFFIGILLSLVLTGTIGYKLLLNLSLVDALYMTVITISTVGYAEVGIMDTEAKMFSILLIFISLGTVGYLFTSIMSSFLEGDLKVAWRRRRMEAKIMQLQDHYIICGAGETGYNAIKQFKKSNVSFVVIDQDQDKINDLMDENIQAIHGDATQDAVLEKARIKYAKGLISSLPNDAENVYTVLTARQLNSDLYIVARAIDKHAGKKLKHAGANNTICPNEIGGTRMASLMLRPNVISFLDIVTRAGDVILDLEDVVISAGSSLIGQQLKEAQIPQKTRLIVLAIKKGTHGLLSFNPNSNEILKEDDTMIVLGRETQVKELKKIANDTDRRQFNYEK